MGKWHQKPRKENTLSNNSKCINRNIQGGSFVTWWVEETCLNIDWTSALPAEDKRLEENRGGDESSGGWQGFSFFLCTLTNISIVLLFVDIYKQTTNPPLPLVPRLRVMEYQYIKIDAMRSTPCRAFLRCALACGSTWCLHRSRTEVWHLNIEKRTAGLFVSLFTSQTVSSPGS